MSNHDANDPWFSGKQHSKALRAAFALKARSPFKDWSRVNSFVSFSDKTWRVAEVNFFVTEANGVVTRPQQPFMIVRLNVDTGEVKDFDLAYQNRHSTPAELSLNMHDFVRTLKEFKILLMKEVAWNESELQRSWKALMEPVGAAILLKERSPFNGWPEVDTTVPVCTRATWPVVEISLYVKDEVNPTTLISPLCVVWIDVETNLMKNACVPGLSREHTPAEKRLDPEKFSDALCDLAIFIRTELRKGRTPSPPNSFGQGGLDPC